MSRKATRDDTWQHGCKQVEAMRCERAFNCSGSSCSGSATRVSPRASCCTRSSRARVALELCERVRRSCLEARFVALWCVWGRLVLALHAACCDLRAGYGGITRSEHEPRALPGKFALRHPSGALSRGALRSTRRTNCARRRLRRAFFYRPSAVCHRESLGVAGSQPQGRAPLRRRVHP